MNWHFRILWIGTTTLALRLVNHFYPAPVWQMLFVWSAIVCAGSLVRYIYHLTRLPYQFKRLGNVWAIAQTFTFITFTRLFFRSGSNLDPAVANEVAWNTAKNMVNQIGGSWNFSIIPQIIHEYRYVFILIVLGMFIHWLPDRFKRWYRLNFALLPIPVIALLVILVVFVVYQFITADLQAFIYFQF